MHDTAMISGQAFCSTYGDKNFTVVDVGGLNVNGSLRNFFEEKGMKYICVDIEEDKSVDVVIKPGDRFPFETGSIDLVVSSSCFEHDPCFWITFKEICRIVKKDGYIYVSAPSNGVYHCHPGDNWRFYSDAGQALAYWSGYKYGNEEIYPVKVIETFHILPKKDMWTDFVCVWKRVDTVDKEILVSKDIINNSGKMEKYLNDNGIKITKKFKWI
jgi:SAM-dependent methyltransferase